MLAMVVTTHTDFITTVLAQAGNIGKVDPTPPPESGRYTTILSWVLWAAVIAAVGAIIVAGAMLGYQRWSGGGGGDAQQKLVGAMISAALIASAGTIVNQIYLIKN
ncbi:hypothetical protein ACWDUL_20095 [Nocardia niigatensis]